MSLRSVHTRLQRHRPPATAKQMTLEEVFVAAIAHVKAGWELARQRTPNHPRGPLPTRDALGVWGPNRWNSYLLVPDVLNGDELLMDGAHSGTTIAKGWQWEVFEYAMEHQPEEVAAQEPRFNWDIPRLVRRDR